MSTSDPAWYAFRNAVYAKEFGLTGKLLRERPGLLRMVNGIGETVLHFLAVENDEEGVAWLHGKGADLDAKNEFGDPVLFEVAVLGYKNLFIWFLEHGVNARATNAEGQDVLQYLLDGGHDDMAAWVRRQLASTSSP